MGGEVHVEGVHVELRQLLEGGFVWLNTSMKALVHGREQDQVLVVKPAKLLLADHDLLFVFVGVAADVELLGLL